MKAVVAGTPDSRILLDRIAGGLETAGWHVSCHYGADFSAVDAARWADADIAVCYGIELGARELGAAPRLRGIVSPTIGYEWIDEDAASALGIAVANGAVPENRESMAEAAVLLMLAALYDLPGAQQELARDTKSRTPPRMLKGKRVGLVGYGEIARAIVARLAGWGAEFLAHRRSAAEGEPGVTFVPLETLLAESDIVLLLASLNESSRGLIDAAALDRMKRGAILVNIARGGLVDERALVERLADGRLSMAALDVFETEPLPAGSPLRNLTNTILTPHAIGHTVESFEAIPGVAIANAQALGHWELPASTRNGHIRQIWLARR